MSNSHERASRIVKVRDLTAAVEQFFRGELGVDTYRHPDVVVRFLEVLGSNGWQYFVDQTNRTRQSHNPPRPKCGFPSDETKGAVIDGYRERMGGQIRRAS